MIYGMISVLARYTIKALRHDEGLRQWYVIVVLKANYGEMDSHWASPSAAFHFCFRFGPVTDLIRFYNEWWAGLVTFMRPKELFLVDYLAKWRIQRPRSGPNHFTPFLLDEIVMEDFPIPPEVTNVASKRPPPSIPIPSPSHTTRKIRHFQATPTVLRPISMHKSSRVAWSLGSEEQRGPLYPTAVCRSLGVD
ncbi:hypothetical protein FRC14_007764 [Serendipita sp. 396]|nr:hypothetical protein FRC14_007764 [Serendipita sp. 396]